MVVQAAYRLDVVFCEQQSMALLVPVIFLCQSYFDGISLLSDDPVPVNFAEICFRNSTGNRTQTDRPVTEFGKLILNHFQRKRVIVFLKNLLLNDPVLPLKRIQQIKADRAIRIMIPDLYKIDSRSVMKKRIIEIVTLLLSIYLFPSSESQNRSIRLALYVRKFSLLFSVHPHLIHTPAHFPCWLHNQTSYPSSRTDP